MHSTRKTARRIVAAALCVLATGCAQRAADPLTTDPPADPQHPASMQTLSLPSHGEKLNAVIYEAAGAGPHPTLVMLHGYPGGELNLDIAQAARRAGWNALWFHYRGAWGSGGEFSFAHAVEDAQAVFYDVRAPEFSAAHRVDPARVSIFGHSMGGFAALMTGAAREDARCTVSVAGANFGVLAAAAGRDQQLAARIAALFDAWGNGAIRDNSGKRLVDEAIAHGAAFDVTAGATRLATRPLLLVAANQDDVTPPKLNHEPLLAAVRAAPGSRVQELRLDTDHSFAGKRIALTRGVVEFLRTNCQ